FDDVVFIINNAFIRNFSWEGIKTIFSNFSDINYAPVTDLINSVIYKLSELNPAGFHITSVVFHLINIVLVFWFVKLLNKNWQLAAITALLFGIHPMQVESVAWASGGSNLYSTAFFLFSLICYLSYLQQNKKAFYIISLLSFIISLLSKSSVIMLPLVLILIDYFKNRKTTLTSIFEKIPFFLISLGAGILAIKFRSTGTAFNYLDEYSILERVVFAGYGFISYLINTVLPIKLSAFYPYPENIPVHYYLYLIILIGLIVFTIYSRRYTRKIIFSIGFFAAMIFIVLQLLPTGRAIMADRYFYLPSIGIFYLAAEGFNLLWNKRQKTVSIIVLGIFAVFFSINTHAGGKIWKDNLSLWDDVIKKYPTVYYAYYNRGHFYMEENKNQEAIDDYSKAIGLKPDYIEAYVNRGYVLMNTGQYEQALNDLNKAVEIDPEYINAYIHRGNVLMDLKEYNKAYDDFSKVISLNPDYTDAYVNRGNVLRDMVRFDEALKDYEKAIQLQPGKAIIYFNRGSLFMKAEDFEKAQSDFNKAIELKPDYEKAYNNLGSILFNQKNYIEAIDIYSKLIKINPNHAVAFFNRGLAKYYSGDKEAGCDDFQKSASLGYSRANDIIYQLCN
ncbi:MAG: tetratricopeptide repeat protein, partial [Prolixibacteraceae bacterium]|nr:tetratricopeptide repeat protein [Prolixibacteraceae bacterium]